MHRTLRGELLGKTGAAHRDCARNGGDGVLVGPLRRRRSAADAVYAGMTPLVAEDIAEVIGFVATRPAHVNLDQIVIRPRDQATATRKFTRPEPPEADVAGRGGVVVGVPDSVGASVGVTGAVLGMLTGAAGEVSADIDFHSSQSTAQSQMSPSE